MYLSKKYKSKAIVFALLIYEDGHSPAMKHTNHIRGVNDLVQEINNIIQNKQECQTMEYNIQLICCSCKITEIKRKRIKRKHRKKHDSMEPVAKKRFLENIKRKYSTIDARKKKELFSHPNEKLVKARSVELYINQIKRKL